MCLKPHPQWPLGFIFNAWTIVTPFWFLRNLKYVIKCYSALLANSSFRPELSHSLLLQVTFSDTLLLFGWVFSDSRNNTGTQGNVAWKAPCCCGKITGERVKRPKFLPRCLPLRKLWGLGEVPSPLVGVSRSALNKKVGLWLVASKLHPSEPNDSADTAQVGSKRRERQSLDPVFSSPQVLLHLLHILWFYQNWGEREELRAHKC